MKTIILDGSNIIRNLYNVQQEADFRLEKILSDNLMRMLQQLNSEEDIRVEVYFDGPKRDVFCMGGLVDVWFSKNKKADDLIVNSVQEITNCYGGEVLVVSQDKDLRDRCSRLGAHTMSAREFIQRFSYFLCEQIGQGTDMNIMFKNCRSYTGVLAELVSRLHNNIRHYTACYASGRI